MMSRQACERISVTDQDHDAIQDASRSDPNEGDDVSVDAPPRSRERLPWTSAWQIPTILLSLALIAIGLYHAGREKPGHDFDGALTQIEAMISSGEFEVAATRLGERVQPFLNEADPSQVGWFNALVGDVLYLAREHDGTHTGESDQLVIERYRRAQHHGFEPGLARLERWAMSLVRLGELGEARRHLEAIEGFTYDAERGTAASAARRRVLRRLVEETLRRPGLPFNEAIEVLGEYRAEPGLEVRDELWAIARQGALRLDAGIYREAVDHLLIDMRRIEPRAAETGTNLGELYVLLARGFLRQGEYDLAHSQLDHAMMLLEESDPVRGEAYLIRGQTALAVGDHDRAFDAFSRVVSDYHATRAELPALLGRAETQGILGRHAESRDDFEVIVSRLRSAAPRRDLTTLDVGRALSDRHDAMLAMGRLDLAHAYIAIAERLFTRSTMPTDVLSRLASTNRQIADNLIADAVGNQRNMPIERVRIDPAVRRQAAVHYRRAGEFFIAHARSLRPDAIDDTGWSDSLWFAADSYDLAGEYDLAVEHFLEYIAGRSDIDPRRAEAKFRLAQAHRALGNHDAAAARYEEVIAENPRSMLAAQSHVPLSECYLALDRPVEAEQQLRRVIAGDEQLDPDALEYRDALFALGTLHYNQRDFTAAIEVIERALSLYPDDPRATELRYRQAESYRRAARRIATELETTAVQHSRRVELEALRTSHLQRGLLLFSRVRDAYEQLGEARLDTLQRDYLRMTYLAIGDCAYDLGEYPRAIELYDQAARRYPEHAASLIALIQIVNAYTQLGDHERARTAHHRAQVRLQQIPPEAFRTPEALMDETAWRQWLDALPPGVAVTRGVSDAP